MNKYVVLYALLFFTNYSHAGVDRVVEDVVCLANNIYYEASIEPRVGKRAVAWVVLNRYHDRTGMWPNSICGIVNQPSNNSARPKACAFSWTCDGRVRTPPGQQNEQWAMSVIIAWLVLSGQDHYDPTFGAKHYVRCGVRRDWLRQLEFKVKLGRHCFYE